MKATNTDPTVWGVFVWNNGEQLPVFNSKRGPFPPEPGTEGYIAIGWPAIGDLSMFEDSYADFVHKFRIVYGKRGDLERIFMTRANMPWSFAFVMKKGDRIISPCSSKGVLLVGEIIGDYEADFHDKYRLAGKKTADLVHLRKVRWTHIIPKTDRRYKKLNRIGKLTLSQQRHLTFADLRAILGVGRAAA